MAREKVIDVPDGTKYCPHCGETKPLSEFGTFTRKATGKVEPQSWCKSCQKLKAGSSRESHVKVQSSCKVNQGHKASPQPGSVENIKRKENKKTIDQISAQSKDTENTKLCPKCGEWLDKSLFYCYTWEGSDRVEYSLYCIVCSEGISTEDCDWFTPEGRAKQWKASNSRRRIKENTPHYILKDSKYHDKIKGRENDLDEAFIAEMIADGCSYCGATSDEVRIGLDRIDNNLGHLKSNVVATCTRCNNTRRHMPIEAWLIVARGMCEAREKGKFGNWDGCTKRGRKQDFSHERQDEV